MEIKKPISLTELAKILDINKSKLSYYVNCGLLKPVDTVGKLMIFDRKEAINCYKRIQKYKNEGYTLHEIKKFYETSIHIK